MSAKTKSTRHSGESRNLFRRRRIRHSCDSRLSHPSHSCEGRNLRRRKAAGNCTSLQFAPSVRRFLPSQEWDKREGGDKSEFPVLIFNALK
ncbi:MAG: hypothetical protein ACR2QC_11745 [Gammaproteobacteria bacterium]